MSHPVPPSLMDLLKLVPLKTGLLLSFFLDDPVDLKLEWVKFCHLPGSTRHPAQVVVFSTNTETKQFLKPFSSFKVFHIITLLSTG